ncbi:MAG: sporulation protein [Paenibacillaceae bacterium]|jgi:similar to stage IV sporulation protein|nr:sporulation protein [Paenibacillaceae bacterium]
MQPQFVRSLRGYVAVTIRGDGLEPLLNLAVSQRFSIWEIRRTGSGQARAKLLVRDFFRLRPLLKQTGCRVHVETRHGFPFFLGRLGKRKFFVAGLVGFFIGIYLLSSMVWQVKVEGNDTIPTYEILRAAREQGIKPFQWKFRLKPLDELARDLNHSLPEVSWIGVEKQGTRIVIKVVESSRPEQRELLSPRHLVARKSAVVTQVQSTKGKPMVEPNRYVKKGDVLISGILGNETNRQVVAAEGTVRGIIWYESRIEVPLIRQHKVYTGEVFKRFYLVFGGRALQITGYGKTDYEASDKEESRKTLGWRNYMLPVGWLTEKVMEVRQEDVPVEPEAARAAGLERAKADILMNAGKDAKFVSYNVLQEKTDNGKVYMNVLFQVEETITEELAIVQGE